MISEIVILNIKPGQSTQFEQTFAQAQKIIAAVPGYQSHQLQRCIETSNRYILMDSMANFRSPYSRVPKFCGVRKLEDFAILFLCSSSRCRTLSIY